MAATLLAVTGPLISQGIPCGVLTGCALILAMLARHRLGLWCNPVAALLLSWFPMGLVLLNGWVMFHPLQPLFVLLVTFSLGAFISGALLVGGRRVNPTVEVGVDPMRFRSLVHWVTLASLVGFVSFILAALVQVGWEGLVVNPNILRLAMGTGAFVDPLKLLNYATMLLPILLVIAHECSIGLGRGWWVVGVLAIGSNLLSTGRTKVIWSLLWVAFAVLLARERRDLGKALLLLMAALVLSVAVFGGMSLWLGKTFPATDHSRYAPEIAEEFLFLGNPFYYLGTNLPYFQEILSDRDMEIPLLANLVMPYYKFLRLAIPEISLPSEVLPVIPLPRPANTGTWLVQFFFDAGLGGILLFPFLIGLASSAVITYPGWADHDPMRLYMGSLLLFLIWIGFIGNKFLSTPTWIFVGFGLWSMTWVKNPPAAKPT